MVIILEISFRENRLIISRPKGETTPVGIFC